MSAGFIITLSSVTLMFVAFWFAVGLALFGNTYWPIKKIIGGIFLVFIYICSSTMLAMAAAGL